MDHGLKESDLFDINQYRDQVSKGAINWRELAVLNIWGFALFSDKLRSASDKNFIL